jgi:hypothetical protein
MRVLSCFECTDDIGVRKIVNELVSTLGYVHKSVLLSETDPTETPAASFTTMASEQTTA